MKLITRRMTLIALEPDQLAMLGRDVHALERELTLSYHGQKVEGHLRDVIRKQARVAEDDDINYLWHTFWMFNLGREMIGSACFKGPPDTNGVVEIGYGINPDFENEGYTTEAVEKLTLWALSKPEVKNVIAETEKDNAASRRVLIKAGFKKYKESKEFFYYVR